MRRRDRNGKKNPTSLRVPEKPPSQGPGRNLNTSFFFTNYVMQGKTKDRSREEDPREALLKINEVAQKDPMYLGDAYAATQPKPLFLEKTFEQELEESKKKPKLA